MIGFVLLLMAGALFFLLAIHCVFAEQMETAKTRCLFLNLVGAVLLSAGILLVAFSLKHIVPAMS